MAINVTRLVELGMVPELAKELATQIDAAVLPENVTGFNAAVEEAVAAKTEIAALTGASAASAITTALQA